MSLINKIKCLFGFHSWRLNLCCDENRYALPLLIMNCPECKKQNLNNSLELSNHGMKMFAEFAEAKIKSEEEILPGSRDL